MAFSSDIPLTSNQLAISIDFPKTDDPRFLDTISLFSKRISDSMNTKEGALYDRREVSTFQQWFPTTFNNDSNTSQLFRPGYRTTYDLVAMNGGVAIPVGVSVFALAPDNLIDGLLIPTHGYGTATTAGPIYRFFPNPDIDVSFDNTNPLAQTIILTNNTGSTFSQCYFVFEYLKT